MITTAYGTKDKGQVEHQAIQDEIGKKAKEADYTFSKLKAQGIHIRTKAEMETNTMIGNAFIPQKSRSQMARVLHHPRLEMDPPDPNMDQQGGQDRKGHRRAHREIPERRAKRMEHPKANQRPNTTTVDIWSGSLGKQGKAERSGKKPAHNHPKSLQPPNKNPQPGHRNRNRHLTTQPLRVTETRYASPQSTRAEQTHKNVEQMAGNV